jgi:MerR family mercuric resistance operon transcriptional regulator
MEKLTISKLAKLAGVGVETIRFYQRKDLLREPKALGAFRIYSQEDAQKIVFIKRAQDLGFTLNEVKELLELNTKSRVTCSSVKSKTEAKIKEIENKIADLNRMKKSLGLLACACDGDQDQIKQYKVQECFEIGLGKTCKI